MENVFHCSLYYNVQYNITSSNLFNFTMYADDTTLHSTITLGNDNVQESVNKISEWLKITKQIKILYCIIIIKHQMQLIIDGNTSLIV